MHPKVERRGALAPLLVSVALACGHPGPGVVNRFPSQRTYPTAAVLAAPTLTVVRARELCTRRDTPPCSLLSHTRSAYVAPHHGVVLLDSHEGLMQFDSVGRYIRGIGALGSEPGEYLGVSSLVFADDSTAWVIDPGSSRGIRYVDGRPQASVTFRSDRNATTHYLASRFRLVGLSIPITDTLGQAVVAEWGTVGGDGEIVPVRGVPAQSLRAKDDFFVPEPPFFTARPMWTAAGASVVYVIPAGDSAQAILEAFTPTGTPKWRTVLALPTRRPTPVEIAHEDTARLRRVFSTKADSLMASCRDSLALSRCIAVRVDQAYASRARRPYPVPSRIVGTANGDVWLRGAPIAGRDSVDWFTIDSTGQLRGRLRLAQSDSLMGGARSEVLVARADPVAGVRAVWLTLERH